MAQELIKSNNGNSTQHSNEKFAYVTFLAGKGDYVKGVVGLAKGLRKAKSAYCLVVAVLPDVPEEHRSLLVAHGCILKDIEPCYAPGDGSQFVRAYYAINYSKLHIWRFVEYEKLIYLDGDMLVYDNIDHLFDLPNGYLYGVVNCFCDPGWIGTPQYEIGYCQQTPEKVHWPVAELGPPPIPYFNAGFFVFEPSLLIYDDLIKAMNETPPTSLAEQDLLNNYFRNTFKPLPLDYNMVLPFLWRHPEKVNLKTVKVVHYCALGSKPWSYTGKEVNMNREDVKMLVKWWCDIYDDPTLDYNSNLEQHTKVIDFPDSEILSFYSQ